MNDYYYREFSRELLMNSQKNWEKFPRMGIQYLTSCSPDLQSGDCTHDTEIVSPELSLTSIIHSEKVLKHTVLKQQQTNYNPIYTYRYFPQTT